MPQSGKRSRPGACASEFTLLTDRSVRAFGACMQRSANLLKTKDRWQAICPLFLTKIVERVDVAAVSLNAEVAVDTAGDAAAARFGDLLALVDRLSRGDEQ